jgi:hypothetical protein
MRELEVLDSGYPNLSFLEWKEFFEEEPEGRLRSHLKVLIEQALEVKRDYHLQLDYYEHASQPRVDHRNGYYYRDFPTRFWDCFGGGNSTGNLAVRGRLPVSSRIWTRH